MGEQYHDTWRAINDKQQVKMSDISRSVVLGGGGAHFTERVPSFENLSDEGVCLYNVVKSIDERPKGEA